MNARGIILIFVCVVAALRATPDVRADFTFGEPVNLGPIINGLDEEGTAVVSLDGLEMYMLSTRPGGYGEYDIWVAQSASVNDNWGTPANVGPQVNSSSGENPGSLSADGLQLFFSSTRPDGYGSFDLYAATRPTREAPWASAVNLGPVVNGPGDDDVPVLSADGLELIFDSSRAGGVGSMDIWVSNRASISDPWGPPRNLGSTVNSSATEVMGCLSPDGLTLFFNSDRSTGYGNFDIWMARRSSLSAAWGIPVNLGPAVNTSYCEWVNSVSRDGLALYFDDSYGVRPGGLGGADLWQALIIPIVDFNADRKVDLVDLVLLIDNWGTNNPVCDIGPMPWGDGKVDIEDLKVFMTYYEKENPPKSNDGK